MDQLLRNLEQIRQLVENRVRHRLTERSLQVASSIAATAFQGHALQRKEEARREAGLPVSSARLPRVSLKPPGSAESLNRAPIETLKVGPPAIEQTFLQRVLSRLGF